MKIFKDMGNRLHRKCDSLTQPQRRRVLIILSVVYLILTAAIIISAFLPDGIRQEKESLESLIENGIRPDSLAMPELIREETSNTTDYGQGH